MERNIEKFFESKKFGVVGASNDRNKFGNKVLRTYMQQGLPAIPINPHEKTIEGLNALQNIYELPDEVTSISIITPPQITDAIVEQAIQNKRIKNIWMQPGAESEYAIELCKANNINIIARGPCILVELGFRG